MDEREPFLNRKLRDRCPACDRNGLVEGGVRRRCTFCFKDEPRSCDRVLYTVCCGEPHFVQGKGWFLRGWRPYSEPMFGRDRALRRLAEMVAKEAAAENWHPSVKKPFATEPLTIDGKAGAVVYTNGGPEFYFVSEQVVDCSAILQQE